MNPVQLYDKSEVGLPGGSSQTDGTEGRAMSVWTVSCLLTSLSQMGDMEHYRLMRINVSMCKKRYLLYT